MEQYYRMVIELHKDALIGELKRETIKEVQTKLATEITKVRITGGNDTELSPDSILNTESPEEFIEDFPHRNCINKVYVSRAIEPHPCAGDILVFYRTGGYYKSVITTIGEAIEVKYNFLNENDFILYCRKKSVYPEQALREMWRYSTRKPFVVNFLYVYSFPHRINMKELIDLKVLQGINDPPRGFKLITKEQFKTILEETKSDESFIID